ncbi:MAG TPA: MMPL family transporter, partial [Longimicrobiales bacterium]|nr:MMPL family transporter [Longimicrobiales bacterium]
LIFFVFPAMLRLVAARWPSPPLPERRPFRALRRVTRPTGSRAGRIGLGAALLLAGLGFAFGQYSANTNLLELQPSEGEAVRWQRLLLSTEDRTTYALATYPDRPALERAREAFRASPVVGGVETAFPSREEEKRALLAPLCETAREIRVAEPGPPSVQDTRRELFGLRQTLRRFARSGPGAEEALAGVEAEVTASFRILGELPAATAEARLASLAGEIRDGLAKGLERGRPLLCPPALSAEDLPGVMRDRFVGSDGTLALRIYPARDTWEGENLEWFVEGARRVDPGVFGAIVNVHENAEAMIRSFIQAAGYSSLALLVLLLLWSRSLRTTVLALLPLVVGMGLLLGLMRWNPVPIRWNLANLFSVPIIIGIGIAGGIHLVRAWRLEGEETFHGAVEAVLMSSLTTMIGFGLLATGEHAGVSSLGLIVFLGIALNLLVCLTALPVALAWADSRARKGSAG